MTEPNELLIHASALIRLLPPGKNLEKAVEIGVALQGATLDELAATAQMGKRNLLYLLQGLRGKRGKSKRRLEHIRELAAPAEIIFTGEPNVKR